MSVVNFRKQVVSSFVRKSLNTYPDVSDIAAAKQVDLLVSAGVHECGYRRLWHRSNSQDRPQDEAAAWWCCLHHHRYTSAFGRTWNLHLWLPL